MSFRFNPFSGTLEFILQGAARYGVEPFAGKLVKAKTLDGGITITNTGIPAVDGHYHQFVYGGTPGYLSYEHDTTDTIIFNFIVNNHWYIQKKGVANYYNSSNTEVSIWNALWVQDQIGTANLPIISPT